MTFQTFFRKARNTARVLRKASGSAGTFMTKAADVGGRFLGAAAPVLAAVAGPEAPAIAAAGVAGLRLAGQTASALSRADSPEALGRSLVDAYRGAQQIRPAAPGSEGLETAAMQPGG